MIWSLILTGLVPAAKIVGTARSDTLRGTPNADKLSGRLGDDRLFGLRGNDVLVGGPGADRLVGGPGADRLVGGPGADRLVGGLGADRLVCGTGRDVASADAQDVVASDCETVRGRNRPPPSPPPAALGSYCGSTSQGMSLCFEVEAATGPTGRRVRRIELAVQAGCGPLRELERSLLVDTIFAHVLSDRRFVARPSLFAAEVQGTFDPPGTSASGSLRVQFVTQEAGVRYECDSGPVTWQARTPPPGVPAEPGTFCGLSDQGLELCFDVTGTPKTVTNLKLFVRTECVPEAAFGVTSTIPTKYAIREDGSFSFRRRGLGAAGVGGSFAVQHTMSGMFDTSGAVASGTLAARVSYDAPDGTHYECDSSEFRWSVQRQ